LTRLRSAALTAEQVLRLRLRAQRLDAARSRRSASVADVVRAVVGLQAQDAPAAALSARARRPGLTAAQVEAARVDERSVVRTWVMRGTLHLIAAEDYGWLLGLLGPVFARASRGRRAQLGLDDDTAARGVRLLRAVLGEHGPLTRAEMVEHMARRGLRLEGQARPHLLGLAALQGVVCHGPRRGREPTYVLTRDWITPGPALPTEAATAELARRYLAGFAPAAPEDFAAWSGLPLGAAREAWRALRDEIAEAATEAGPLWLLRGRARPPRASPAPIVRLLPAFDTYLLGYRERALLIAPAYARRIYSGAGLVHPALLVDGRAVGAWKLERRGQGLDVKVAPFEGLAPKTRAALEAEGRAVARFLDSRARLTVT
jgi:hypothetical protein